MITQRASGYFVQEYKLHVYICTMYTIYILYNNSSFYFNCVCATAAVTGVSDQPDLNRSPFFTSATLSLVFFSFIDRTNTYIYWYTQTVYRVLLCPDPLYAGRSAMPDDFCPARGRPGITAPLAIYIWYTDKLDPS